MALEMDEKTAEKLARSRQWAEENGSKKSLEEMLSYLAGYGGERMDVRLRGGGLISDDRDLGYFDVYFLLKATGAVFMNGGLVYHKATNDWSVHT